jgi:hypothetical protein
MDASYNTSRNTGMVFSFILILLGFVGLYYLYYYLFGQQGTNKYTLLSKVTAANPVQPIAIPTDNVPALFEGGEFTVSTWIYVNNWSYRSGFNKSILNIGGPNFDTLRIYLGGYKPQLMVRFHTKETALQGTSDNVQMESLEKENQKATFDQLTTDSNLLGSSSLCDLPEIELQRWINITVAVNGRTVDVYLDGKLARSCVLPALAKVDDAGYSVNLLAYGGFGGLISTTMMYDGALNPDAVYKLYMAGPEPITSIQQWFSSFFA